MHDTVESLAPWFYDYDLGPLGRTESKLPDEVKPIHQTRLQMVNSVVDRCYTAPQLRNISAIDIACHEGFYAVDLAKRGLKRVLGIDVRKTSLKKSKFVSKALGLKNTDFRLMNAEEITVSNTGRFEIALFLGLLYHLENPMLCLRNAAAVTTEVCILETQIIDEVEGETEWGMRSAIQPYRGVLALIDESAEFDAENPEMGATPLVTCPSRKGLVTMLQHAGFKRIEFVDPPPGAYEQHARGKRVVCAAYKY